MEKEAFRFSGEAVSNYDTYLGPLLFEPYAKYISSLISPSGISWVLEIASGTGRLTRYLRKQLPASVSLTASDISPDMLNFALVKLNDASIDFQVADIQYLPFKDNSFDLVVCQFGVMFLPDKQKGFNEVLRVLKPGGKFIFSTWDSTENIPLLKIIFNDGLLPLFKNEDVSRFLIPFAMHHPHQLLNFLETAGFKNSKVNNVRLTGNADSANDIVNGFLLKHSLANEVTGKDPAALLPMANKMQHSIEAQFGTKKIVCELSALIGTGEK